MTSEEFIEIWGNVELRQYIIDKAKDRSRNKETQEDCIQEAWLAISTCPGCADMESLKVLAEKAIYSSYWQWNKERLMQEQ